MNFEPLDNLQHQVGVITGANGGIGRAVCQALAESGATIVGITRSNINDLEKFLSGLPGIGHRAFLGDVTVTADLEKIKSNLTQCDILVTSAGHSRPIPHREIDSLSDEFFEEMLISNLRSVFSTIRTFHPLLLLSKNALIVNISSASTQRPGHGSNIAYIAAKAGVEAMTKNLALALAPEIRVVSVCPSSVDTGFLDHGPEFYNRIANLTPLKRIGTPKDIATTVEAVATKLRFVTGNTFVVDGGRTL